MRAACHPLCRQSYQRYCRQTNEHCAKTPHLGAFSCCDATSRHDGDRPHAPPGHESAGNRGTSPRVVLPLATRCRRTTLPHVPPRARRLRVTPSDLRGTSAEHAAQPRPTGTGGKRRDSCLKPDGGWGGAGLTAIPPTQVVRGDREGRAQAGARHPSAGAASSPRISLFMWIPQQISCGIHMIMVRAAVRRVRAGGRGAGPVGAGGRAGGRGGWAGALPPGQAGQNGHARPGAKAGRPKTTALGLALALRLFGRSDYRNTPRPKPTRFALALTCEFTPERSAASGIGGSCRRSGS